MTAKKRYAVVCPRFVSAGFGEDKAAKSAAENHLIATKDINKNCPGPHTVEFTAEKYGSRSSGGYSE